MSASVQYFDRWQVTPVCVCVCVCESRSVGYMMLDGILDRETLVAPVGMYTYTAGHGNATASLHC